ncbi:MAG: pyridoxamine 5'-phosphate oxidase family protein [Helicobacteraceae bacterium]|jgi:nitroimidazol reductase NimA-like FMN-containing flavoprotein (pyridoxamine 5'-phosphate oxidase superfamily)|nr:pyridoxamine 5'-phosphate oxidase family protein [Helicobacteraceae bacterium]
MRRKDREVKDFAQIMEILSKCEVMRVAMIDKNEPYIVALNFGFETNGERLTLYFHGASEGRKIAVLSENPRVCFEADRLYAVATDKKEVCKSSCVYESVVGWGGGELVRENEEKQTAIGALIRRYGFEGTPSYDPAVFSRVLAWKIKVDTLSAKRRFT